MQNLFVEHIVFSFAECIISRFDVVVNDVDKEFAEMLRSEYCHKSWKNVFIIL